MSVSVQNIPAGKHITATGKDIKGKDTEEEGK